MGTAGAMPRPSSRRATSSPPSRPAVSSLHAGALARQGTAALGLGALAAAAGLAITALGPVALLLAPLAVALYVMLTRPAAALGALLVVTVVLEEDEEGFLPVTSRFYEP